MLVEFRVQNFRSFRDEQVLSLVASSDDSLKENLISVGKLSLLKTAGVYGPNASGKSNLIKAVDAMRSMVVNSAATETRERTILTAFRLDPKWSKRPSTFEVVFYHDGSRYQYGFSADEKTVSREWLYAYPKGYPQLWFERSQRKRAAKPEFKFGAYLKGDKASMASATRRNVLFLSMANQWNNEQLSAVHGWFDTYLRPVQTGGRWPPVTARMLLRSRTPKRGESAVSEFVTRLLQSADLGIHGVDVEKVDLEKFTDLVKDIPSDIRQRILDDVSLKVDMLHRCKETGESVRIPLTEESDGTRRFFELLGPWLETVTSGYTVFIDELEASLHPMLTRELVKFIHSPLINDQGAQVIFCTHDTTLLDPELFRRDQIWFTEKSSNGATQLYSMADYKERKVRKGEAMQKGYLSGRYGAIPILKSFGLK